MNRFRKLAVAVTAAASLAALLPASAFADSRNGNGTWRDGRDSRGSRESNRDRRDRAYRDDERVTVEGRVRTFRQERDGYRIHLDSGRHPYFVPSSHFRNRGRNAIRVGMAIRLGGVFRGGSIHVDSVGRPDGRYYDDSYGDSYRQYGDSYRGSYVRGMVTGVNLRRGILTLRDDRTGRMVNVDMRHRADRRGNRSIHLNDLRRGDRIALSGQWHRGVFAARRIESVRSGRY